MNRPLFSAGVILYIFVFAIAVSLINKVVAQEFDATMEFTAQGQGYWQVMVDGVQVSQHTTEREAYESATNQWFITDGAQVQVIHNAVIDVEGFISVTGVPEPTPEPDPSVTVQIPGASEWQGVPEGLITKRFAVLNDDWVIASDNQWLYAYNVSVDSGDGWIVHRPSKFNSFWNGGGEYLLSETTPLTEEQVVQLITSLAYD